VVLLTALAAGFAVQFFAFVVEIVVLVTNLPDGPVDEALRLRLAATGAVGLAAACAVAVRVGRRRCLAGDVAAATARWTPVVAGLLTGALVLAVGLVVALGWLTLPVYAIGVVVGTVAGAVSFRRRFREAVDD
jgi:hypothetical protein